MSTNDNIGSRLREERGRLELSQMALAKKLGVSRATQVNYESEKRVPGGDYLLAFGKLGADIGYILCGERTTPAGMYSLAANRVVPLIAKRAGIDFDALSGILSLAAEDEAVVWSGGSGRVTSHEKFNQLIGALFERGDLLGKVFILMAKTSHEIDARLPPAKKADLVLMLYKLFKDRGKVDGRALDVAVRAAAT